MGSNTTTTKSTLAKGPKRPSKSSPTLAQVAKKSNVSARQRRLNPQQLDDAKASVLEILYGHYVTTNGISFSVEPAEPPDSGDITIVLITLHPKIKIVTPTDMLLYWKRCFVEANLPVPIYIRSELFKIDGIWHIYYLYENDIQEFPAHHLKNRSANFHVVSDLVWCVYCRKVGHQRSECPVAKQCKNCLSTKHATMNCTSRS